MRLSRVGHLSFRSTSAVALGTAGVVALAACVLALSALPAQAEVYHVKLRNGTSIDTAYQPQQAPWDPTLVVLLTDSGNFVGLPQKDVESVSTESEVRGFGVSLNFNTVAIGWAPNDVPEPTAPNAQSTALQALQNMAQQQQEQAHYTVPQFVNTDQTQGIPARFVGTGIVPGIPAPLPQLPAPITLPAAPAAPAAGGAAPSGVPNQ
jgi:hypothetical protein